MPGAKVRASESPAQWDPPYEISYVTYASGATASGTYWSADAVTGAMKAQGGLLSFSTSSGTGPCLKAIGAPVAGSPSATCTQLPAPLEDMDSSGSRLLVAHARGLDRYQVNDATRVFAWQDGYPTMGDIHDIVVQPPYIYFVDAKSGFEVWHFDEMAGTVARLGRLPSATGVRLTVSGNTAYLAGPASDVGVSVIAVDVTAPGAPVELGRHTSGSRFWWDVWGIERWNTYLYVLGRFGPVQVIDVGNPKAMATAGSFAPGVYDQSIAIWHNTLVVGGGEYPTNPSLRLCDLSVSPTAPPCSDRIPLTRDLSVFTISGDFAIAVGTGYTSPTGTSILDLSTRQVIWSGPSPAGSAVAVRGDSAYVLGGNGEIHVMSLVNPSAPTFMTMVGGRHLPGRVGSAAVEATTSSLLIVDPESGITIYRRPVP